MANKELTVYDIFQGQQVRNVDRSDEKVWRVLIDCCRALGIGNSAAVAKRIPSEHLNSVKVLAKDGKRYKSWRIVDDAASPDLCPKCLNLKIVEVCQEGLLTKGKMNNASI